MYYSFKHPFQFGNARLQNFNIEKQFLLSELVHDNAIIIGKNLGEALWYWLQEKCSAQSVKTFLLPSPLVSLVMGRISCCFISPDISQISNFTYADPR